MTRINIVHFFYFPVGVQAMVYNGNIVDKISDRNYMGVLTIPKINGIAKCGLVIVDINKIITAGTD